MVDQNTLERTPTRTFDKASDLPMSDRLIASDRVTDTAVFNRSGDKLGSIKNFMVDKVSGRAEYAVMEFGGILGIGSDFFPIPWDMLEYDEKQEGYVVDIDEERLNDAPRFREKQPTYNEEFGQRVYGHYGMVYPYA